MGGNDLGRHRQPLPAELHDARTPFDVEIVASTMFMAGEPMNPATKRFTGWSYRRCGVSTCCSFPFRITATRSPMVIASTWSCVT